MAKRCPVLGEFVPHGQEFLADDVGGSSSSSSSHCLVARERDGLVAEEELYIGSAGQVVWSSGRHVLRGFQARSQAAQVLLCSFSALHSDSSEDGGTGAATAATTTPTTPSEAAVGPTSPGRCLCILEPEKLTVHAPSGAEFLVHTPLRALHVWALADGLLVLLLSRHGSHHVISVLSHPLSLPRCVSYIGPGGKGGARKDSFLQEDTQQVGGNTQLRWVSCELPLAVAHLTSQRCHAVFLLRRRLQKPAAAGPRAESDGAPNAGVLEASSICCEPSDVFLQELWRFPDRGPACSPEGVCLLAPETEFARDTSGGNTQAPGLLMVLFTAATHSLTIVRLWSWEVVLTLTSCCSAVPLLPGDDLRACTACPSGLAGFPSPWCGSDHCRVVFQEEGGLASPDTNGLPQLWTDLLLDPLELTRTSAVYCFDRHRLPQYLLVLEQDHHTLTLHWGAEKLCQIEMSWPSAWPGKPVELAGVRDAVANRFTLALRDGRAFRCSVPLRPHSARLSAVLRALALMLPAVLAHRLMSDVQVWCVCCGGRAVDEDDDDPEWRRFCELIFCLIEQALAEAGSRADAPPFKRARTASGSPQPQDARMEAQNSKGPSDWEWLLGSSVHARERLQPRSGGLSASKDFVPHCPLRESTSAGFVRNANTSASSTLQLTEGEKAAGGPQGMDVWEGPTTTPPQLLLQHVDSFFLVLHLLYEEWKMHSLHVNLLPPLALLLYGLASRLQCPRFAAFYLQDMPAVADRALAMCTLGGYGAWLWDAFPHPATARSSQEKAGQQCGESINPTTGEEAIGRLRSMQVPNLLRACRSLQSGLGDAYPAVFPLSRLVLSLLWVLQGGSEGTCPKASGSGGVRFAHPQSIVHLPNLNLASCGPPSPLLPLGTPQRAAQGDVERARAVRRWLQGFASGRSCPHWEVVLMLLVQQQITRSDVDLWSPALAVPVQECLRAAAEQPSSEWLIEAYTLIGREDLALLAKGSDTADPEPSSVGTRGARDLLDAAAGLGAGGAADDMPPTADPLGSSEWLHRMFDRDRRAAEVARLLSSSRPIALRVIRRPEQTDHDFEHFKQSRLGLAAARQAAVCVGRGAFSLGAVRPLPTELLPTPPLTLAGRFPPQAAVVSLDPNHHNPELNIWAEFSNGVATALQVSDAPGVEITRGWILHHRSEASASGQSSAHAHAGFLCGLGLRGSLKVMPVADCYRYLRLQHDTTSVAVILGMAASHVGSMDAGLTRMCCVHIPSMLPATYSDMEVASPVQCTAVLSLGLLFARSAHRMMTELLVAEIGRRPSDRALHDREGYSLAAGFALGCICLGQGADAPGLADLQLHTWLLRYVHGGPAMPMPGAAMHDQKSNPNHDPATSSSLITEPDGINVSVTSPGGCVALALIFLRTNCEAVASRIVIPQNVFQLDYIRPDFSMLRLVARCLIMWDDIWASDDWVESQLPPFLLQLEVDAQRSAEATAAASAASVAGQSVPTPRTPRLGGPTTRTRAPEATGPDAAMTPETPQGSGPEAATVPPTARDTPSEVGADIDWLLVGQTRASLIAGACLAIGLRFAGTSDPGAKALLIGRLRSFRDARRSETHPALMASLPLPGMDLDRSTLETCQSVTAVALGMVMAGTGDLDALRVLRSLRKRADLETSCGVHMATHMAIGFLFLGGGRYTFDQDPLSIAALFMAAFPRFPTSLTDNRCHLQAFRHLYVLAARHRCVEAVEVDTKQPVDVKVCLQTDRGLETATLPRLMLTGPAGGVQGMALRSERYWPVAIERASPCDSTAKGRWMRSLEASRRLYVKRRSGHLAQRLNHMGAQGAEEAWFPSFTAPEPQHLERLLQLPRAEASAARPQLSRVGGLLLTWLQRAEAAGGGPLEPGTLAVSPAEWAAALCSAPAPLLPPGACELDFTGIAGEEDGSLTERFASLFSPSCSAPGVEAKLLEHPAHVRFSHWLHECIIESKLATYPLYLLIYLQTQHAVEAREGSFPPVGSVTSTACSAVAVDQLNTVEYFYRTVSTHMGAKHRPLLTEEFLAARCAAVRGCFSEGGNLDEQFCTALRSQQSRQDFRREQPPAAELSEMADEALVAIFARMHGLPGDLQLRDIFDGLQGRSLSALPRLRRLLPHASVQGLRRLLAVLEVGAT